MPSLHAESPVALTERATESLDFIRSTMERSASFTALPGRGGMAMGLVGLAAAWISWNQAAPRAWLVVWVAAAAQSAPIGLKANWHKATAAGLALW